MTTGNGIDLRRTDLRTTVLENPYWMTSGELTIACDDKDAVLFSFPITDIVSPGYGNTLILLHELILEVNTAFTGGTLAMVIGNSKLASDVVDGSADVTDMDPNMYWEATDGAADIAATGFHYPTTASAYLTAKAATTWGTNASIIPHDTDVLAIVATITSDGTITTGSAYMHAHISVIPAV